MEPRSLPILGFVSKRRDRRPSLLGREFTLNRESYDCVLRIFSLNSHLNTNASSYWFTRIGPPLRSQVEMQLFALDQLLEANHQARLVWVYLTSLNLEDFCAQIQVSEVQAGPTAIAPEILVAFD